MEHPAVIDQTESAAALQEALIDELKRKGSLRSAQVEAAFRAIPRHRFVANTPLEQVYRDSLINTKQADGTILSTSSAPSTMAMMLEQLDLQPGQRVLEIGAGTGFNAALIGQIVGKQGQVITIDIDEGLVQEAQANLQAAGLNNVQALCRDGAFGYAEGGPYDRIIFAVGAPDLTPALREQLKPGGRLLMPLLLVDGLQASVAFEQIDGYLQSVSVQSTGFMTLRGALATNQQEQPINLGPTPGLSLLAGNPHTLDANALYEALQGASHTQPTGLSVTPRQIWTIHLWLRLREMGWCSLIGLGPFADPARMPYLFGTSGKLFFTDGMIEGTSICCLTRSPAETPPIDHPLDFSAPAFDLWIRHFGDSDAAQQRLLKLLSDWKAAGAPTAAQLHMRLYPLEQRYVPAEGEYSLTKTWNQVVVTWR